MFLCYRLSTITSLSALVYFSVEVSCQTCCMANVEGSACEPFTQTDGSTIKLADGKSCVQGSCENVRKCRNCLFF